MSSSPKCSRSVDDSGCREPRGQETTRDPLGEGAGSKHLHCQTLRVSAVRQFLNVQRHSNHDAKRETNLGLLACFHAADSSLCRRSFGTKGPPWIGDDNQTGAIGGGELRLQLIW